MIHRILKGLAPLAALAGAALVTGCDNMNIHIGDGDGVPLAELDMSGAAPTELVLAGPDKVIVTEGEKLDIAVSGEDAAVDAVRFSLDEGSLGISRAKDMGKIGGVARVQKDVATTKCSVKAFLASAGKFNDGSSGTWPGASYHGATDEMAEFLSDLEVSATEGKQVQITCNSSNSAGGADDGFNVHGIINNISLDASKGAFPMLDLSFEGVGRMNSLVMGTGSTLAGSHGGTESLESVTPLVSTDVTLGTNPDANDTINSAKFAFDLPTETLSRLGGLILGLRATVANDNAIFSKPPYKASMTVDGQSLDSVNTQWGAASANGTLASSIGVQFQKSGSAGFMVAVNYEGAAVSSRSFSQNVGDVGATFSVSAEGTDATFTAVAA